jgi:hypothetical protein
MLCSVSISKGLIRASFWDHKFSYWAVTLAAIHDASLMFDSAPAESNSTAAESNSAAAE